MLCTVWCRGRGEYLWAQIYMPCSFVCLSVLTRMEACTPSCTCVCTTWWLSWRNWARPHLPTSRRMNQKLHCSQFEAFMLVCACMDECAERQETALWLLQAVVVLVFGRVWMGFAHCVPVPLCTRPLVSQAQCVPVPLRPSPVASQSCHVPVPLCPCPILYQAHA